MIEGLRHAPECHRTPPEQCRPGICPHRASCDGNGSRSPDSADGSRVVTRPAPAHAPASLGHDATVPGTPAYRSCVGRGARWRAPLRVRVPGSCSRPRVALPSVCRCSAGDREAPKTLLRAYRSAGRIQYRSFGVPTAQVPSGQRRSTFAREGPRHMTYRTVGPLAVARHPGSPAWAEGPLRANRRCAAAVGPGCRRTVPEPPPPIAEEPQR